VATSSIVSLLYVLDDGDSAEIRLQKIYERSAPRAESRTFDTATIFGAFTYISDAVSPI